MAINNGSPIPNAANTMWKASDMAIWERAKRKSLIPLQPDRFQVLINLASAHWIQRGVRLINGRITRFRISTLWRADDKRENGTHKHDSGNHFEGFGIVARALAHVRDQGRPA